MRKELILLLLSASLTECYPFNAEPRSVKAIADKNPYLEQVILETLDVKGDQYDNLFAYASEDPIAPASVSTSLDATADDANWVFSPDGQTAVAINATTSEPDSSLDIYNRLNDQTVERLEFCGTPCEYLGVYWLDNSNFAFVQIAENYSPESDQPDGHVLMVHQYDLSDSTMAEYRSAKLEED
ncbi:MAG: hypothetical protein WBA10_02715 [Elainellaceae cyanobacterium]